MFRWSWCVQSEIIANLSISTIVYRMFVQNIVQHLRKKFLRMKEWKSEEMKKELNVWIGFSRSWHLISALFRTVKAETKKKNLFSIVEFVTSLHFGPATRVDFLVTKKIYDIVIIWILKPKKKKIPLPKKKKERKTLKYANASIINHTWKLLPFERLHNTSLWSIQIVHNYFIGPSNLSFFCLSSKVLTHDSFFSVVDKFEIELIAFSNGKNLHDFLIYQFHSDICLFYSIWCIFLSQWPTTLMLFSIRFGKEFSSSFKKKSEKKNEYKQNHSINSMMTTNNKSK